ncbi:MAG: cytochrome-c peroxidase [Bacteroidia bacterium]
MVKIFFRDKLNITGTLIAVSTLLFSFSQRVYVPDEKNISNWYIAKMDSAITSVTRMDLFLQKKNTAQRLSQLKKLFEQTRFQYKQVEFFIEHNYPYDARLINGPLVPEVEGDDLTSEPVHNAEGFQLAESLIYTSPQIDNDSIRTVFAGIKNNLKNIREAVKQNVITPESFMHCLRLENERIIIFNLTGFDNNYSKLGIAESFYSLKGIKEGINILYRSFENPESDLTKRFNSAIDNASAYLILHNRFDDFNRIEYIRQFYLPLASLLKEIQNELQIQPPTKMMGYNMKAENIFAKDAISTQFFSSYPALLFTDKQAALGRLLFFEPLLSGNNQRACASCHQPSKAFADNASKNFSFDHAGLLKRNTPSLLNAVLQQKFFYDSRSRSLEQQIEDVLSNENELHTNLEDAALKLNESDEYKQQFKNAFEGRFPGRITSELIKQAIVAYELTLVSLNSDFDKFMQGDVEKLNKEQENGFNLFAGKAKCATCHYIPLFNGTVPPFYMSSESEVIGTTEKFDTISPVLSSDSGKFSTTRIPFQLFAFKTPTLRNAELTAPYMHNGNFNSLNEVLHFYNEGGGAGLGLTIPNQTLDAGKLNLSEKEISDIISFLKSLNDTSAVIKAPESLPQYSNRSEWNLRKIGGRY